MYDPHKLETDSQGILDELVRYHSGRLHEFEKRREMHRKAQGMDGSYDLTRLLSGMLENQVSRLSPYEKACSDRIAERLRKAPEPGYAYIPVSPLSSFNRRDLTAGIAGAGGYLVNSDENPGNLFIGTLLTKSVVSNLGIEKLSLQGNAAIPKVVGNISTTWLSSESSQITEGNLTFGTGVGTPKSIACYAQASDRLLKQTTPGAQDFILKELGRAAAAALDSAVISGSGASGQPLGIMNTSGIGSVTGTSLAFTGVLDMMAGVEDANALIDTARTGWIVEPTVARLLRAREKSTGSGFIMNGNEISGHPALSTNSAPTSSLLFGDWSSVVLVSWDSLQIGADPFGVSSELFKAGLVSLRAIWSVDLIVLRPSSFCKSESIS